MITALIGANGAPTFNALVNGVAVYLDNFAIKCLAKGDADLRARFLTACHSGAELLFSITNAVEILGPQGESSAAIRAFLNDVGPHWYPIEMNLQTVIARESDGYDPGTCCYSEELLVAYYKSRTSEDAPGSGRVIDLSANFFKLGLFIDFLLQRRDWFDQKRVEMDGVLTEGIRMCRIKAKANQRWLDFAMPRRAFDDHKRATFVHDNLIRNFIADRGDQLKRGDGIDFYHAVMASAYANFAALDKHWKRRIENLPKPNRLARIYYEPEIAVMIADIESALLQLESLGHPPLPSR
jgi:hypothetical protein